MSSAGTRLVPTNLPHEDMEVDDCGVMGARYYCLPPFWGDRARPAHRSGKYAFYLIAQGYTVGIFDNWLEAKASVTGYPDNSYKGCATEQECIEIWQRLCRLGVHPHPVEPASLARPSSGTMAVDVSPRKSEPVAGVSTSARFAGSGVKRAEREGTPDFGTRLPPSPSRNYVIRGGGIVSSSAERTQSRYIELQRQGEEPDLLITRSLAHASFFAVEDDEVESEV
ncbi:hypothetical protein K438DRAFT_2016559 [Mycena galopus ATCC 62051]|nr:hypothetical protein K438DRAFT_2016559 [Mycena galopus ATCC 62051]